MKRAVAVAAFGAGTMAWNTAAVQGGRGDVVGSFNSVDLLFLAANFNWKF